MGGEGGVGVDVRKACEQFTQESPTDRMSMIGAWFAAKPIMV